MGILQSFAIISFTAYVCVCVHPNDLYNHTSSEYKKKSKSNQITISVNSC